jgi:phytoene dehydrogenase-like protein
MGTIDQQQLAGESALLQAPKRLDPPGAIAVGPQPHVVIIGAGFAGLSAAKALAKASVHVTLIDRNLATVGRKVAVADFGFMRLSGHLAWWLWGAVHIFFLLGFRNRIAITLNWLWAYFTFQRGSRLITGPTPLSSEIERNFDPKRWENHGIGRYEQPWAEP